MLRIEKDLACGAVLDDLALMHDGDGVGDLGRDAQVVRDKEHGEVEPLLDLGEELQNLRLDGDVQRGDGLVGDEQLGFECERACDANALALAAGELVRIALGGARVQLNELEKRFHALAGGIARMALCQHSLGDDVADAMAGIERRVRILEYHLHERAMAMKA